MQERPWEYDGRIVALTRNVEAIGVALNRYEELRAADAKRVETLIATLIQQNEQIGRITQQIALLQAQLYEAGVR